MDNKRFFVKPQAVLFHNELDKKNNYETIVCNWKNTRYIRINSSGYKILRLIYEQPGLSLAQIAFKAKQRETGTQKFLEQMLKENIIFAK